MIRTPVTLVWSAIALALFLAAVHAFALPPHGFFCGDQGAKYLQARAFAEQGPWQPAIAIGASDLDPEHRFLERALVARQGRVVSEFSWLLALLSAPFIHLIGIQGAYVLPGLAAIAILVCAARLSRRLGPGDGVGPAWIVVLGTPVLFYGAELWEHAPAAALVMVAAALLLPGETITAKRGLTAGCALGLAALFREEAVVALPAFALARMASADGGRIRSGLATAGWSAAGFAAVYLAVTPLHLAWYGSMLPIHLTVEIARNEPYWIMRSLAVATLLLPDAADIPFVLAVCVLCAVSALRVWRQYATPQLTDDRTLLLLAHVSVAAILMIGTLLPLAQQSAAMLSGVHHSGFNLASAARTWPLCLAIAYWPWVPASPAQQRTTRFLLVAGVSLLLGTLAIIPTPGGAQWSPRYLLPSAVLLGVVAAVPAWTAVVDSARLAAGVSTLVRVVLLTSVVMQAGGLVYLRDAKTHNARIAAVLARETAPGDMVVTDVFWFPQVTAIVSAERRMLVVPGPAAFSEMAGKAEANGLAGFVIVTSSEVGSVAPAVLRTAGGHARFTHVRETAVGERGLVLHHYAQQTSAR